MTDLEAWRALLQRCLDELGFVAPITVADPERYTALMSVSTGLDLVGAVDEHIARKKLQVTGATHYFGEARRAMTGPV